MGEVKRSVAQRGVEQVGVTLERALKRLGIFRRVRERMALEVWREVVGAPAARNTRPVLVRRGELLVSVSSSTWAQELSLMRNQLLAKLNARLGDEVIHGIRFAVDPTLAACQPPGRDMARGDPGGKGGATESEASGAGQPVLPEWQEEGLAIGSALGGEAGGRWLRVRALAARRRQELEARGWKRCSLCGLLADPREGGGGCDDDPVETVLFVCGACLRGGAGRRVREAVRALRSCPWMSQEELAGKLPELRAMEIRVARAAAAELMRTDLHQQAARLLAGGSQEDWTAWRTRAQELVLLATGLPLARIREEDMKRALGDLFPIWLASRGAPGQKISGG